MPPMPDEPGQAQKSPTLTEEKWKAICSDILIVVMPEWREDTFLVFVPDDRARTGAFGVSMGIRGIPGSRVGLSWMLTGPTGTSDVATASFRIYYLRMTGFRVLRRFI